MVRVIEETVKYEMPKNHVFALGKLIQEKQSEGWNLDNIMKGTDFVYPIFVRCAEKSETTKRN